MSLSITIDNINDLTDVERAVLQIIVQQWRGVEAKDWKSVGDAILERAEHIDHAAVSAPVMRHKDGDTSNNSIDNLEVSKGVQHTATIGDVPASAELDTNGLPWDKRIHSSGRAKVADGRWRYARNIHPALITEVEAELRAVQAIPVPVLVNHDGSQAFPADAVRVETENGAPVAVTATVPVPPAPTFDSSEEYDGAYSPASAPAPAVPLTFADLMKHVTPMLVAGKLPQDKLLAITGEFGLPHLAALGARPDLVEAVKARIDAEVGK